MMKMMVKVISVHMDRTAFDGERSVERESERERRCPLGDG